MILKRILHNFFAQNLVFINDFQAQVFVIIGDFRYLIRSVLNQFFFEFLNSMLLRREKSIF